jgi:hypothetical protein
MTKTRLVAELLVVLLDIVEDREHRASLAYTIHDDGLWLFCSCGAQLSLGFDCTPKDAVLALVQHQEEAR